MGRKPVRLELISNRSSRASTFKKRRASVIKKAEELSKLCGIDVCVFVTAGPDDAAPVTWPSPEQAAQIKARLQRPSVVVQTKKQSEEVEKLRHQLQKIEHETDNILKTISDGSCIGDTNLSANLSSLIERRLKEVQDRINFLKSAPVQHHPVALNVGCATGPREAMLPARVVWSSTENGMELGSTNGLIGAAADPLSAGCTVEVQMPGVLDTIDMEQDPVMGSIGADGTNLPVVLPDESTGSDCISNGVPFLEWDDELKDWILKFGTDDVAPLPDLADFDVGCSAGTRDQAMLPADVDWPSTDGMEQGLELIGAAAGSFPAGCTVEVEMSGLLDSTTDIEQDPITESVGADGTNLVNSQEVLTSEEEMPGFPTGSGDWISSGEIFPGWDDMMKDWMLEPSTAIGELLTIDDILDLDEISN